MEENLIACTEIVQTWLAIGCLLESESRTFAVTSLQPKALAALAREGFLLHSAEAVLLGAVEHLR